MNVSIVSRGELNLVGIKVVGRRSELSHRVPLSWIELVDRLDAIPHLVDRSVFYGSFPESDHQRASHDGVYTYWVCTEVSARGALPEGLRALVLPARTYATARIEGASEAIEATYVGLSRWIEEHGRRVDARAYCLERYDQRRQRVTPPYERFDYEVWKPLDA
ncbi:AraC family transcriptional regulator [Sorangium cellulosum]|uniref:AraC family transcriptional regulator n=1 Tax=Sorangium cellulosum TaxID=56 RepID=A0A2L0ER77_SORCE|nr:GyrI-like domain-containing protein [Sorangium cellulosum]AUX41811.1 AraC family transcriptional regulator [Sorangium cellulosum]